MGRWVGAVALLLWACGGPLNLGLDDVPKPGLEFSPRTLVFPLTAVGTTSELPVEVSMVNPTIEEVRLSITGPFRLDRSVIPTGRQTVTVTFEPQENADVAGNLLVIADESLAGYLPVSGQGRDPRRCVVGDPCSQGSMDPESGACVLTPEPEGKFCATACIASGSCSAGKCVGTELACDDGNDCTEDSCLAVGGCTHAPRADGTECHASGTSVAGQCVSGGCVFP